MAVNRVIFFAPILPGFLAHFGALARYLSDNAIPSAIYSLKTRADSPAGWAKPEMAAKAANYLAEFPEAVDVHPLALDRERPTIRGVIRTGRLAFSLARRNSDTIFVLWSVMVNLVCGLPLRALQRRCVFIVPSGGSTLRSVDRKYRVLRPIVRRLYAYLLSGRNSRVIVHNHETVPFLRDLGVETNHIAVTPGCGVDPEEFPFSPVLPSNEKKIVLVPVRLMKEKGVFDAASASDLLRTRGIDHEMWFSCSIDPGNPSSLTEEEVRQVQQNSPSTRFVGYHTSLVPLYMASDVVCVPTRYPEGLPTVLLEAAASGRPIVATDNMGCREFVEDGVTGLMAPIRSPSGLADALARVLTDEVLADRLRKNAFERYRAGFTKADMVRISIDVMRNLDLQVPAST